MNVRVLLWFYPHIFYCCQMTFCLMTIDNGSFMCYISTVISYAVFLWQFCNLVCFML